MTYFSKYDGLIKISSTKPDRILLQTDIPIEEVQQDCQAQLVRDDLYHNTGRVALYIEVYTKSF